MTRTTLRVLAALAAAAASPAWASALVVPFDPHGDQVGLEVKVNGRPARMILDTGTDPSGLDLAAAERLGATVKRDDAGKAEGVGDQSADLYGAAIPNLEIGGRRFGTIEAAALDMAALRARHGKALDGILGYSFLKDRIVLIDYPANRVAILDAAREASPMTRSCALKWSVPLRSYGDDTIPVIPDFRFGDAKGPASLDTGAGTEIGLLLSALQLPGIRVRETGERTSMGFRGTTTVRTAVIEAPVGFGPFELPTGQAATIRKPEGSPQTRVANVGNRLMREMRLKVLLDYRSRTLSFFGRCGG